MSEAGERREKPRLSLPDRARLHSEALDVRYGEMHDKIVDGTLLREEFARILVEERLEIEVLTRVDRLTGLLNQTGIREWLEDALSLQRRHNSKVGVILMDVDHFKQVNDTYGHPDGDKVLLALAEILNSLSDGWVIGRDGGEEFLVVIPDVSEEELIEVVRQVGEVCAKSLAEMARLPSDFGSVTVSIGASIDDGSESADELRKRVDGLLYMAKRKDEQMLGRNRGFVALAIGESEMVKFTPG